LNQLSEEGLAEMMRGFGRSFRGDADAWALEDAREIEQWDSRITAIEQIPMFKDIPRYSVDADMRRFMDYSDKSAASNIVHVRV
jgi:hypothetical protein